MVNKMRLPMQLQGWKLKSFPSAQMEWPILTFTLFCHCSIRRQTQLENEEMGNTSVVRWFLLLFTIIE